MIYELLFAISYIPIQLFNAHANVYKSSGREQKGEKGFLRIRLHELDLQATDVNSKRVEEKKIEYVDEARALQHMLVFEVSSPSSNCH